MLARVACSPFKIPSVGRLLCAMVLFVASSARAQMLTERGVVERALARPDMVQIVRARVEAAQGRAVAAGARPNPQFNYMREQTYNASGTGEDYVSVAQTIHLGGRYRLQRQAAEARARARAQDGLSQRLVVAADARSRFYECLHREQRVAALVSLLGQVEHALQIVQRRAASGDAARYYQRRLERERAATLARLEAERAHLSGARHRLGALVGLDADAMTLSGSLLPEGELAPADALRKTAGVRPDLVSLEQERLGATLDARAARRAWIPELRLEGGYKGIGLNAGGRTDGFLAGGYLTLPLWDRGTGLRQAAEAEARALAAQKRLTESELDGELSGARAETSLLREAAVQFRETSARLSADLMHIASVGYEGGELGLLELLDAYRGAAEDELAALDMELASRRALIDLDRLTGLE